MKNLSEVRRELLLEGLTDYVGVWEVSWILRRLMPSRTTDEIRDTAMEVLDPLIREGLIEVGTLREHGGFLAWTCTAEQALVRIDEEWRSLGQDPNIGQICWFSNTASGDRIASHASRSGDDDRT